METGSPDTLLIRTKLHRPQVAADHVHRPQLLDRLNNQLHRPLTLVSAPAGYGKSTLISCWLNDCDLPSAWLSIEESENDLRLFITYFLAAVQTVFPQVGKKTESFLKAEELPPIQVLAGCLVNELDEIDQAFILVIDDLHQIHNKAIHGFLDEIIKHPPHAMHLVLASRVDPPLSLARLRAKGQLTEIRIRDLRFSQKEATEFLQQMLETTVEDSLAAAFEEKTEGWITGLHLAALSLRNSENTERVLTGLPDDNHLVMDYLVSEILSQQPPAMQEQLLKTSILNRFCAPLCDAVCTSDKPSADCEISGEVFLQLLKKYNLFVINLDDEQKWYRYHHLFQNLLSRRLKDHFKTEETDALHVSACDWFTENSHFEEAIKHALMGNDIDRAVRVFGMARYDLMNREQWQTLERWLNLFPVESIPQHSHLIVLRCWLDLYLWYRLDNLFKDLACADTLLETTALDMHEVGPMKAEVAAIRGQLTYWTLEPSHGMALVEQALRDSPDGHECTRSTAIFDSGALSQMLGKAKQGERLIWDKIDDDRYTQPGARARIMLTLCLIYWPEMEERKLRQAASRLLQFSLERELLWSLSFSRYFLGLIHYERNELNEAVVHFETIVDNPYRYPIQNVVHCSILLSLCYQVLGLPDQARKIADSISKLTFERGNQMFIGLTDAFQADLDLRQGRTAQADQWADAFVVPAPHALHRFFNTEFTYIRIMLNRNTISSLKTVAEQLDVMLELTTTTHHRRLMIDVLGMKALLADGLGHESSAFETLIEALVLAEAGEIICPFLDLGQPMQGLLQRLVKGESDLKFARLILDVFSNQKTAMGQGSIDNQNLHGLLETNQTLAEPLTNREIEILLILAKGLSNHVIADKLFISPETVKRHLYNIYQKLDVKNRQQAAVKASSLGLL
ncbi:MAG: LuxR C-terminal-related transcriptional regulator [Gammaproteobacteria bacterium]|nr:LuxR C-terminal-related transcriptional regulator [Gammaproteobacteria bacterium]